MTNTYLERLRRNIPLLYTYNTLTAGLFHASIWIVFQKDFLTFPEMAFFNALFFIAIFVFELPTGALADILGRKRSLIAGSLINAVSYYLIASYQSYGMMFVFVIINGLGDSLISGANESLAFDSLKETNREEEYPTVASRISLYFQLFAAAAILVGGYLYTIDKSLPYYFRSLLYFGSVIPALFLVEPHIDSETFTFRNYIRQTKLGFIQAFRTSYLAKLSILYVIVGGIAMSTHRFFSQAYMLESGLGDITRSWLTAGVKIVVGLLTLYLASKKQLFTHKYFLLLLPALMSLSLIGAQFNSWPIVVLLVFGIAFPSGSRRIFIGYPVQQHLVSKYRATALSSLNMLMSILYAITNLIGGVVVERSSTISYYTILGVFIALTTIPLTLNIIASDE